MFGGAIGRIQDPVKDQVDCHSPDRDPVGAASFSRVGGYRQSSLPNQI
jgi:hypothetical protein